MLDYSKIKGSKRLQQKKTLIEMEADLASIRERVRDLEWTFDMGIDDQHMQPETLLDQRRRAIDKMKHTIGEIAKLKKEMVDEDAV